MNFSITKYGRVAGVSASAIRYYESENLLPKAERRGGKRVYYTEDIPRLKLVVAARKVGFGIKEIKSLLGQKDVRNSNLKKTIVTAAQTKAHAIQQQIKVLEKQHKLLTDAQSCLCSGLDNCSTFM